MGGSATVVGISGDRLRLIHEKSTPFRGAAETSRTVFSPMNASRIVVSHSSFANGPSESVKAEVCPSAKNEPLVLTQGCVSRKIATTSNPKSKKEDPSPMEHMQEDVDMYLTDEDVPCEQARLCPTTWEMQRAELSWRWRWLKLQREECARMLKELEGAEASLSMRARLSCVQEGVNGACSVKDHPLFSFEGARIAPSRGKNKRKRLSKQKLVSCEKSSKRRKKPKGKRREETRKRSGSTVSSHRRTLRTSDFDIDNVVIPSNSMGSNVQIRVVEYKEVHTPTWHVMSATKVNDNPDAVNSSDEDTSDEAILRRHLPLEYSEKKRFAAPLEKKKGCKEEEEEVDFDSMLLPEVHWEHRSWSDFEEECEYNESNEESDDLESSEVEEEDTSYYVTTCETPLSTPMRSPTTPMHRQRLNHGQLSSRRRLLQSPRGQGRKQLSASQSPVPMHPTLAGNVLSHVRRLEDGLLVWKKELGTDWKYLQGFGGKPIPSRWEVSKLASSAAGAGSGSRVLVFQRENDGEGR